MRLPVLAAAAAACTLVAAAPAGASSLAYTKNDNVWLSTPDGSYQKQVTTDGTSSSRYQAPDQLDDGTIVVSRPSSRFFYALRQDGSLRNAPLLAPGNSCGTGPLDLDATPDTGLIVFQYVHSDYCFNPTPGNGPRSRVTFAFSDVPTGSATFPKHDNWTAPRWTPGTSYASMVSIDGGSVGIQGGGTVSPWLTSTASVEQISSFDISRTGNRVLVETVPPGTSSGPSKLVLWQNDGVPASQGNTGSVLCTADSFASGDADPRWSPDGSKIAWEGPAGIYVSPAPVANNGVCALSPQLVVPGGHDPAWGAADVARPASGGGTGGDSGQAGGSQQQGGSQQSGGQQQPGDQTQDGGQTGGGDRTPPAVTIAAPAKAKLAAALKKGVKVPVTLSEASRVTGTLTVAGPSGRKLALAAPVKVAAGSVNAAAGKVDLVLRFNAKAQRKLRRAGSVKLTLQVVAVDGAGNQSRATPRKLTLKH